MCLAVSLVLGVVFMLLLKLFAGIVVWTFILGFLLAITAFTGVIFFNYLNFDGNISATNSALANIS